VRRRSPDAKLRGIAVTLAAAVCSAGVTTALSWPNMLAQRGSEVLLLYVND
jgi:hypothetical protein